MYDATTTLTKGESAIVVIAHMSSQVKRLTWCPMTQQVEMLNRLNQRFGANKFRIISILPVLNTNQVTIRFTINSFSTFMLTRGCTILEDVNGCHSMTDRARWLNCVALDYVRDDEGNLTPRSTLAASPTADLNDAQHPDRQPQTAEADCQEQV